MLAYGIYFLFLTCVIIYMCMYIYIYGSNMDDNNSKRVGEIQVYYCEVPIHNMV